MKFLLLIVLTISGTICLGQKPPDKDLIIAMNVDSKEESTRGLYAFYQKNLSGQILNDCIYDDSCSKFSRDVFKHFGLIKGLMLTADRLTRCNRATLAQIHPFKINSEGFAMDHWDDYEKDN